MRVGRFSALLANHFEGLPAVSTERTLGLLSPQLGQRIEASGTVERHFGQVISLFLELLFQTFKHNADHWIYRLPFPRAEHFVVLSKAPAEKEKARSRFLSTLVRDFVIELI